MLSLWSGSRICQVDEEDGEMKQTHRFDADAQQSYEYELPENFDDEEIDEDSAFNAEDWAQYGNLAFLQGSKEPKQGKQSASKKGAAPMQSEEEEDGEEGEGMRCCSV